MIVYGWSCCSCKSSGRENKVVSDLKVVQYNCLNNDFNFEGETR